MSKLILALILSSFCHADLPFWKSKDKVYERVRNREIIVSVKEGEVLPPHGKNLSLAGGGQVDAPCAFAFKLSEDFAKLAEASGYLENIRYDQDTGLLAARISAYGYKADTELELKSEKPEEGHPFLSFLVKKGPLSGMTGRFLFYSVSSKKCDVGMDGRYGYDRFPLPQFFLRFGMEVMFQRMAGRVRAYAEGLYGKVESP